MEIKLQVGVKALITDSKDRYLILKRKPEKYPEVNELWDIPGGRIDRGMSLFDNLAREVREETSLELTGESKILAAQDILIIEGRHVVRITYLAKAKGKVELDGDEHIEYKWLSLKKLLELNGIDSYLKEVLKCLQ